MSKKSAESEAAPSTSRPAPERRKRVALATSITLLLLSGYLSWRQPTPGQLDPPATFPNLKWFRYPLEVNPENRPPTYPSNWFWYPFAVRPQDRSPFAYSDLRKIITIPDTGGRTLVAVGENATILYTTDGGSTWNPQRNPATPETSGVPVAVLRSVAFTDSNTGWAVGYTVRNGGPLILHTTDSGATWSFQGSEGGGGGQRPDGLTGVVFTNAGTGWPAHLTQQSFIQRTAELLGHRSRARPTEPSQV
jgi:hypothetical protein